TLCPLRPPFRRAGGPQEEPSASRVVAAAKARTDIALPSARNQELDSRALRIERRGGVGDEGGAGPEDERRDSPDDDNHRNPSAESCASFHGYRSNVKSGFLPNDGYGHSYGNDGQSVMARG